MAVETQAVISTTATRFEVAIGGEPFVSQKIRQLGVREEWPPHVRPVSLAVAHQSKGNVRMLKGQKFVIEERENKGHTQHTGRV